MLLEPLRQPVVFVHRSHPSVCGRQGDDRRDTPGCDTRHRMTTDGDDGNPASPHDQPRVRRPRRDGRPAGARQGRAPAAGVPQKTLELVHLRASQINGCGVCAVQHPRIARKPARPTSASSRSRPGATRRTSPTPSAPRWRSPRPSPGSPTAPTRCRTTSGTRPPRHYDEQELAALVLSIAPINVWNRLNVADAAGGRPGVVAGPKKKPAGSRRTRPAEGGEILHYCRRVMRSAVLPPPLSP